MDSEEDWYVLVVETTSGQHMRQELTQRIKVGPLRQEAEAYAIRVATEYQPRHPSRPQARQVFQTSPESWLVQVTGMTRDFFFTVTLARPVVGPPG
jgi:hypothetical protein